MAESRSSFNEWTAGVAAGILLAVYIGGHYATVDRICLYSGRPITAAPRYALPKVPERIPHWFFAPLHAVDRKFRPDFWRLHIL